MLFNYHQKNGIKLMPIVGGFVGSPYLMSRIRQRFEDKVKEIVNPPNLWNVVCCGAIALALNPNAIMAMIARKTYSIMSIERFEEGLDPLEYNFYPKSGYLKESRCVKINFPYLQRREIW